MIHDQARAPLPGQARPHPLDEDADAETRLRQELEMHGGPGHPGEEAAEAEAPAFQHREALANHRHVPFVEVAERARLGLSADTPVNQRPRIATLLPGYLRHPRQRASILLERRGVTDPEDLGMTGHG